MISVIVPVLDEAQRLGDLLDTLGPSSGFDEVIVVDGGSQDGSAELARSRRGVVVVASERGRARQMNAGAASARGDVLLFLHADTRLPVGAAGLVRNVLASPETVAGAFRTHTVCDDPDAPRRWLAPLLRLADVRSRYTRLPYGDQAVFVRAEVFPEAGGFPDIPILEDLALARRLRRLGRLARVPASVRVSGRRFLDRPIYYTTLVNVLPLLFRLGVPPSWLAATYAPSSAGARARRRGSRSPLGRG